MRPSPMRLLLIDSSEGTVISKEQITDHGFFDFCDGL